jgi:hypothetical protein
MPCILDCVNSEWIDNQRVEVTVDNHEWVVVFLPHSIESPNFAGLVCELLCYLSLTFYNDECLRVYTCVFGLCLSQAHIEPKLGTSG